MNVSDVHLQHAISLLSENQLSALRLDCKDGKDITFTSLEILRRIVKPVNGGAGNHGSAGELKKTNEKQKQEIQKLKKQLQESKAATMPPRLQQFTPAHGSGYCSKNICDFAHGTKACPFEGQICRWCLEPYAEGHPAFGKCTNERRRDEVLIEGESCKRILFANRGGKGSFSTRSMPKTTFRKTLKPDKPTLNSLTETVHPRPLPPPIYPSLCVASIQAVLPTVRRNLNGAISIVRAKPIYREQRNIPSLDVALIKDRLPCVRRNSEGMITIDTVKARRGGDMTDLTLDDVYLEDEKLRERGYKEETRRDIMHGDRRSSLDEVFCENEDKAFCVDGAVDTEMTNIDGKLEERNHKSSEVDTNKTVSFQLPDEIGPDQWRHTVASSEARIATRKPTVRARELQQTALLSPLGMPLPRHCTSQWTKHQQVMHVLDRICNMSKKDRRKIKRAMASLLKVEQPQKRDEAHISDMYRPRDATDSYAVQSDNARRNMWHTQRSQHDAVGKLENLNWQSKRQDKYHRGVVKFYTHSRGSGTSGNADLPWGFIRPLTGDTKDGNLMDIHFNLYALQDIPEPAVKRDLVVEYTVIPGTNTAKKVNAVQLERRHATADSGAWMNATGNKDDLINFRLLQQPIPVGTAKDGDIVFLRGVGDMITRTDSGRTIFRNVFWAPECSSTLLSVKMLTKFGGWVLHADEHSTTLTHSETGQIINLDNDFRFSYTPEEIAALPYHPDTTISHHDITEMPGMTFLKTGTRTQTVNLLNPSSDEERIIQEQDTPLIGYLENGLMEFRPMEFKDDVSLCKWHRRLGHASINYVKKFATQQGIHLTGKIGPHMCETCALSKIIRKISRNARERADKFMDRVHADLVGPFVPISREGYKYALILVDCQCREPFIYHMKSKQSAEIHAKFEAFCTETQAQPKEIKADGGKEFQGICKEWCDNNRVKMSLSPPYAHYLNGVVERKIRSIKEMTRCILNYSRLPPIFWADAMSVSAYLLTRLPTTALPDWSSPYETRHGQKPKVDHIKIFGSKVIYKSGTHSTTQGGTSAALSDKGKEGILIGFEDNHNTGTYKIWDTSTHQIVYSNCVEVFEEQNIMDTAASTYFTSNDSEYEEFHIDDDYLPGDDMPLEEDDDELLSEFQVGSIPTEHLQPTNILSQPRVRSKPNRYDPVREAARPQWGRVSLLQPNPGLFLMNGVLKGEDMVPSVPRNDREALSHPVHGKKWQEAKAKELAQFDKFDAYELIDRDSVPIGAQILPTHFIRTIKRNGKFKYRLVASGNFQLGDSCYSPTAAITALRALLSVCTQRGYRLRSADVSAAYLQSPIGDDVYVEQPPDPSVASTRKREKVWKLKKAMYGLRKSPLYWHQTVQAAMKKFGMTQSDTDPCIYTHKDLLVGVWVDDFVFGGTPEMQAKFERFLTSEFTCDAPADVSDFCGIDIDQGADGVTLSQTRYIKKVMADFSIPAVTVRSPITRYLPPGHDTPNPDIRYRELVGALMFLAISTRPDLAFAVHHLTRFGNCYTKDHFAAAMRVAQYAHSTRHRMLTLRRDSDPTLMAYTDASWAGCPYTRRSTSGRVVFYGTTPISWASKLQRAVATSSTESEIYALTDTVKEVLYLRLLLEDLNQAEKDRTIVHCDNTATISICSGQDQQLKRVRHLRELKRFLDIRRRFIQSESATVMFKYCKSHENIADGLTKPLGPLKLRSFTDHMLADSTATKDN